MPLQLLIILAVIIAPAVAMCRRHSKHSDKPHYRSIDERTNLTLTNKHK